MNDYDSFNDQFRETEDERNERIRESRQRRDVETLLRLIVDLSYCLADECDGYSTEGLAAIRRRVANALPPSMCPDWLRNYRDKVVMGG